MNTTEKGIAEMLRDYIQKRVDEAVNKEIEAIAEMVEKEKFKAMWSTDYTPPILEAIAFAIRQRNRK